MKTLHETYAGEVTLRPEHLPLITPDDLVKGEYSDDKGRFCYTGWLLHIFIPSSGERCFVQAYRQFRLATMDRMYAVKDKDNLDTPQARADCFNSVAQELGYEQIPTSKWNQIYPNMEMVK